MSPNSRRKFRLLLVSVFAVQCMVWAGCSAATRTVVPFDDRPLPAMTESRDQLLARVRGLQAGITTLTGTSVIYRATGLGTTTGVQAEYQETAGALLVQRPDHIRMRGNALLGLATVFDMVADRNLFGVSLPARNRFITGATDSVTCSESPILNLRPQHIMDALFVDISPYEGNPDIANVLEVVTDGRRSFYVLSFIDRGSVPAQLVEKVWIDRLDLSVVRKQLFGEEGVVQTDVTYSEWEEMEGSWFPRLLVVERPVEEYRLQVEIEEFRVNDTPAETAFLLPQPPGVELTIVESETDCNG